jgi:hypothetical protein
MAMRTTPTKLGATLTLVGILVTLFGISYLRDGIHGLAGSFASSTGPKFKVEYGYFMIPAVDCPGGRCQRPKAQRLKVQSLGEEPVAIRDVTVNGRPDCVLVNDPNDELRGRELRHIALRPAEGQDSDRQARKHLSPRVKAATNEHPVRPGAQCLLAPERRLVVG